MAKYFFMPEPEPFRFILTKTGTVFRTVPFRSEAGPYNRKPKTVHT